MPDENDLALGPKVPIFVDDSGRRHRVVRAVGWVVGLLMLIYLVLLGVSLVGGPGLLPLSIPALGRLLPDPSAPLIKLDERGGKRLSEVLSGASATPSPAAQTVGRPGARPSPSSTVVATHPTPGASQVPSRRPTAQPTVQPTAKPTTRPTPRATPTPHPHPHAVPSPAPSPTP